MSAEQRLLDELDEARAEVEQYDRRVWWLGFAVAMSCASLGAGFVLGAVTTWPNIPALFGMLGTFALIGSVVGLCIYVFCIGTDDRNYRGEIRRASPRTRLRRAERAYRDHVVSP